MSKAPRGVMCAEGGRTASRSRARQKANGGFGKFLMTKTFGPLLHPISHRAVFHIFKELSLKELDSIE